MATSQNGWPVNPARTYRQVPGSTVRLTVADGPAGDVLMYVAAQFDRRVEDIDWKSSRGEFDDWGWADRPIRGSNQTSNHASATAIDLNATRHPLGVRGTFSDAQVVEIRKILAEVGHVVRWGGDYASRADEMHFEINANYDRVKAVADRLAAGGPTGGGGAAPGQEDDVRPSEWNDADKKVVYETAWWGAKGARLIPDRMAGMPNAWPEGILGSINDRIIRQQLQPMRAQLNAMAALLSKQNGISTEELVAALREAMPAELTEAVHDAVAEALEGDNDQLADEISTSVFDKIVNRMAGAEGQNA
jgi:hypothetical protein